MKTLYKFKVIIFMLSLTACGSGGGGAGDASKTDPASPNPPSIVAPAPGSGPTTVSGTYFTLVKNAVVSQGGNSYAITMTGHCVVYDSKDYCWDDGWQTIPALNTERSFWQLCRLGGVVGQCHGGGSTDPVDMTPTLWSQMASKLTTPPFQPSDIYTQGISTQVTCVVTGSIVDCVDFQIDTNQAPL